MTKLAMLILTCAILCSGRISAADTDTNTAVFTGRVITNAGKPIEGAEITIYVQDRKSVKPKVKIVGESTSDKSGAYRVNNLPPSLAYTVVVKARRYEPQRRTAIRTRYLTFALRAATGSISGRVVDDKGNPVRGVWVKIGLGPFPLYTCRTDWNGRFDFENMVQGMKVIVCVSGDRFTKTATVGQKDMTITVNPDQVRDFEQ